MIVYYNLLKDAVAKINPDSVQLNTLDRPGTVSNLQAVSVEQLQVIAKKLNFKTDKNTIEILTKFRNTIRHPRNKSLNFIDIDKVISYCGNMVYVYFMKCILKIK